MIKESLYQIVYQNPLETFFEFATIEDAIDVLYSNEEINDMFGGNQLCHYYSDIKPDSVFLKRTSSSEEIMDGLYRSRYIVIINLVELTNQIKKQLEKQKEAIVTVNDHISLADLNDYFKLQGFMFRPSKQHLVKYKAPKKVVKVRPSVLSMLRNQTVYVIQRYLEQKYKVDIRFKYACDKDSQASIIRLGITCGFNWETLTTQEHDFHGYYTPGTVKTFLTLIKKCLEYYKEPEMVQPTFDAFKEWYEASMVFPE